MHHFKLTIAYDGSEFHGWQIQPGKPTVQGTLADVARKLTQEKILVHAAGRTDSGVHALGQVVHFRTHSELTAQEFQRAFNALLPPSIRVVTADEVGPNFHARWNVAGKTYQYRILRGRFVPPFAWRYALHYPFPLDEGAMMLAARHFEGQHDFTSFAASSGSEEDDKERTVVREIYSSTLERRAVNVFGWPCGCACEVHAAQNSENPAASATDNYELTYTVRGRSFLRYMVRKMVGTLLDVGRGRLAPEDIPRLFEMRDRSKSGPTVPPQGLYLVAVEYADPSARK
jgi:tRNA pseudouridine38-40 synthase